MPLAPSVPAQMADDPVRSRVELTLEAFEQLGVEADAEGKLYLPVQLRRRGADGKAVVAAKALLTIPTNRQRFRARADSRALGLRFGLDLDRDKAQFDEIENYALLAFCLRDPETRGQLVPNAETLLDEYTDSALAEVWAQLNQWCELQDPRYGDLTTEQLWRVIAAVAVGGTALPLSAMPGFEQATCIVLMARAALHSPSAPSWLASPSTSAAASSTAPPSPASSGASTPTVSRPEQ
jgi:hypothetical protein